MVLLGNPFRFYGEAPLSLLQSKSEARRGVSPSSINKFPSPFKGGNITGESKRGEASLIYASPFHLSRGRGLKGDRVPK